MKLSVGNIIKLSIRYTFSRGDTVYYQRKIPTDLTERFGTIHVKVNLKTSNIEEVASKVKQLNKHYEDTWDAMRNNRSITPSSVRQAAITLLKQYDLKPLPSSNDELNLDHFIETVVERKREKHAQGDEETYRTSSPEEYLTPVEAEAYKLTLKAPQLLLSEALEIYLKRHPKTNNEVFRTYTQRAWNKLVSTIGDLPFDEVNRTHANVFIDESLASGSKTTTVKRTLNVVKAVFTIVMAERLSNKANPFYKLRIAGLGDDAEERHPFTTSELEKLKGACIAKDDDIRWLVALQMDLGCRIAEAAGLTLDDLQTDAAIPYVSIRPHKWRSLKTDSSKRDVPLVGMSLWAALRIKSNATNEQAFAFPRYTDGKTCKATYASNALNDWIKSQDIDKTTHGFRHSMRDRLRNANANKEIQDAVGGWGKHDIGDKYGHGYAMQLLKGWLDKIVT